jgi:hypothetical protein
MGLTFETKISKVVGFAFGIVIVVCASLAYHLISHPDNHVDDIVDNWKELNIYDIVTVTAGENCPIGYSLVNDMYEWPGSVSGCVCGNKVQTGDCEESGCSKIKSTPKFKMSAWRGHKICLFRAGTSVYYAVDDDDCSDTEKKDGDKVRFVKCGSGDKSFCVEESLGCPITKIEIVSVREPRPSGLPYSAPVGDSYVIYYERGNADTNELPIVELSISDGDPCLDRGSDTKDKPYYSLINSKDDECDESDPRYVKIDEISEANYFKSNNHYDITNLPRFTMNNDVIWTLSYRRSIEWSTDCRDNRFSR